MNQPKSNGRGGARKGAGRPPGSATKRTREVADRAAAEGTTPLEYMLALMRADAKHKDPKVQAVREQMKFEAAKAAAPYVHPRLQAIEHSGHIDSAARLTDAELDAQIAAGYARLGLGTASGCEPVSSAAVSKENAGSTEAPSAKPQASTHVAGALAHLSATTPTGGTC